MTARPKTQPGPAPGPVALRQWDGRGYLGLALLGWGLSMILGVTPHEDPFVGVALAAFGVALVATAPRLPTGAWLAPIPAACAGLALASLVVAYDAWASSSLDAPKLALIGLGLVLAATAPWQQRTLRAARRGRAPITVGSTVVCTLAVLGGPLAVWGVQALFKGALGVTPVEAFVRVALLLPLSWVALLLGMPLLLDGQTVTYATPRGLLSVEVGAACSGVQAMALFAGVLAIYLFTERPGGRRLLTWSLIGLAGVYIANLLRLLLLLLVGYEWGSDALLRAHAEAGWVVFAAWAIAFAWLVRRARPVL